MVVVINTAHSGNNSQQLLDTYDHRVRRFNPDVVFLMIGMNDCEINNPVSLDQFYDNLNKLCDQFEEQGAVAVLQTTCPILPGSTPDREPDFPKYMNAIREVAAARKLPLVDHTACWEDNADKHYLWMSNEFYPNEYGHRAFAELLFTELDIWDADSATCRLMIP